LGELVVAKYQLRAKPGLEEVSAAGGVTIVEPLRVPASQVAHPAAERASRRLENEVEVVLHQAVAQAVPLVLTPNLA
jgi:hypothetical protein